MIYAGYLIPFESMHVWLRWISYINPAFYAFEAVMGAEFGGRVLDCVEPQYIPYGAGYTDGAYRSCTVAGTSTGSDFIDGQSYINAQYRYSEHHVWRNLGIICESWLSNTSIAVLTSLRCLLDILCLYDRHRIRGRRE